MIEDAITENMLFSTVKAVISLVAIAVVSLLEIVTVGSIGDHSLGSLNTSESFFKI